MAPLETEGDYIFEQATIEQVRQFNENDLAVPVQEQTSRTIGQECLIGIPVSPEGE